MPGPVSRILEQRIAARGPLSFAEFMQTALYHPESGYYTGSRDPFGKDGDFFTAAQMQPVFGRLIAQWARAAFPSMGEPCLFVDLGAGRQEMREALGSFEYLPVLPGDSLPAHICGVVFANEFLDALPVHLLRARGGVWREMLVDLREGAFVFVEGPEADSELSSLADRYGWSAADDGAVAELRPQAAAWLRRIAAALDRDSTILVIDYGYTARERIRFPEGTLMSYRRHQAASDVLRDPGEQDITAHVDWRALETEALACGLRVASFESLASFLRRVGERDQFQEALRAATETESLRLRLQLKSLLFGIGETFRAMVLKPA